MAFQEKKVCLVTSLQSTKAADKAILYKRNNNTPQKAGCFGIIQLHDTNQPSLSNSFSTRSLREHGADMWADDVSNIGAASCWLPNSR